MVEKKFLGRLVIILLLWAVMTGVSGIHFSDALMMRLSFALAALAFLAALRWLMLVLSTPQVKNKKAENSRV